MKFLEKDLEQIIFEASLKDLRMSGLLIYGVKKRQLKIGKYGIADLVYIERPRYHSGMKDMAKGTINIIELKQNKISVSAFLQAVRYARGIQRFLSIRKPNLSYCFDFNIILIGSEIDLQSSICYLPELFVSESIERNLYDAQRTSVELYTYSYEFTGLKFIQHNQYKLKHEGL